MIEPLAVGECDKCGRKFEYQIIHNGFNDTAYAYCDLCGMTTFVGGWDDTRQPGGVPLKIHGPIHAATEEWLQPCTCGGHFRHDAAPRCPHCHERLSADAATSFIERNAEGTRGGWRWQRSWSGMHCLIIGGRSIKNNWRESAERVAKPEQVPVDAPAPPARTETYHRRNPLLFPLLGIAIAAFQAAREILVSQRLDPFGVWTILAAVGLAILYVRRAASAGKFMFYSLLPIYPAYLVATFAGWYSAPARPVVYAVLAAVWLLGMYFAWRWKRDYQNFRAAHG